MIFGKAAQTLGLEDGPTLAARTPWRVRIGFRILRLTAMAGRAFTEDPGGAAHRRFDSSPAPDRKARLLTLERWGAIIRQLAEPRVGDV